MKITVTKDFEWKLMEPWNFIENHLNYELLKVNHFNYGILN